MAASLKVGLSCEIGESKDDLQISNEEILASIDFGVVLPTVES